MYLTARSQCRRRQIKKELKKSLRLRMDGFSLAYQPIIDPASGLWRGVEALCRWHSPVLGNVTPDEFIPVAESAGFINKIGEWVMETAIGQIKLLGLDRAPQFVLDVNVSPLQFDGKRLEKCVLNSLEAFDYPAQKLCLEITESSEISFQGSMRQCIERLADQGVQFALDDFGTGYATISELVRLPIKTVKTDRSLVERIDTDMDLQRLFYAVSEIAHGGGMHIVAEGVETAGQAEALLLQGADYFQGYHYAKPISYKELKASVSRFFTTQDSTHTMDYSKVDLSVWDGNQDEYVLPLSIYRTLSRCMMAIFRNDDPDCAIEAVLEIVGTAMGVSRAGLFLRDNGVESFSITHQWCAEGITPSVGKVNGLNIKKVSPQWYASLENRGLFIAADVSLLAPGMQALLSKHNVQALAQFALQQGNKIAGFVTFDDCHGARHWTREEIRMLHILANMLTGTISKNELRKQRQRHLTHTITILDRMDALIYVAHLETGEIYFANSKLLQASGEETLEGKTCWEVLHFASERCPYCPMLNLRGSQLPDATEHVEFFSKRLDAHLRVSGSIIPWDGEKDALLVSCINISELKVQQMLLKKSAEIDTLTKVLNRAGFYPAAERLFLRAAGKGQDTALAFLDVDGLKRTNDEQGHAAGDSLLRTVADSIRGSIRDTDIVARVGGDEFIVVFHNCGRKNAVKKLESILADLREKSLAGTGMAPSFSYGVVDTWEHPYQPGRAYIEEMVDKADHLQLLQKTKKHGAARDNSQTAGNWH